MRGVFHQLARCCHFAGHCPKENELPPFVRSSLFLYACVVLFSSQRPLGVSACFNNFLFFNSIKKKLFIFSFPTIQWRGLKNSYPIHFDASIVRNTAITKIIVDEYVRNVANKILTTIVTSVNIHTNVPIGEVIKILWEFEIRNWELNIRITSHIMKSRKW